MATEFVWFFDGNNRHYETDANGVAHGGPIWRKSWRKLEVVGQTRQNFKLSRPVWLGGINTMNVPKDRAHPKARYFAFSEAEIDLLEWKERHAYQVGKLVQQLHDVTMLKQIACMVGYQEK